MRVLPLMANGSKTVLVLGAGINGCAIARELLLNGVAVWIIDRWDLASGATAGSSRLIHGGLRYLEYGEFDLVKESLAERSRLLRLAPQFVHPLKLWIPASTRFGGAASAVGRFFGWEWWPFPAPKSGRGVSLIRAGLSLYDAYARDSLVPRHQVCGVAAPQAPPFDQQRYRWLCSYYDGQVTFPERLVLALLEDARQLAAEKGLDFRVLNYHEATLRGDTVELRPTSAHAAANKPSELRPAAIVNATGAWVDEALQQLHVDSRRLMGGTKGSHLFTFNRPLRDALAGQGIYAEAEDGRPIFITPLADTVLIGTTDVPIAGSPELAVTTDQERDYLLDSVNAILPAAQLTPADVDFHTSAVRPLPYVPASSPGAITRRHALVKHEHTAVPLYSVVGGKLTTMRALAEVTADAVLKQLALPKSANSRERVIPGGDDYPPDAAAVASACDGIARREGLSRASVAAVWRLCGTRAAAILATSPSTELLPGTDLPVSMARWAICHEFATSLADLVERRLMLLYHQRLSRACLERLAELLVAEGHLPTGDQAAVVAAEAERLAARYGKQLA
ncbi:MAG: glycerol-3-phosphate dehydrogenase/oxidase [Pirellulales bacterium]